MTDWTDLLDDPAVKRAYDEAAARLARSAAASCAWGTCTHLVDPLDRRIHAGWGDPLCGCSTQPGWRSSRLHGLPKPGVPAKARGRYGSRVQRSRRRRQS